MPARYTRYRALTDEFRCYLEQREAWPLVKNWLVRLELMSGDRAGRKADIARLKRGGIVAEKYSLALVELLHDRPTIREFLARHGIADSTRLTTDQLVEAIAGPVQSHPGPVGGETDWLMQGTDGLISLFTDFVSGKLARPGTLCKNESDVRTAIAMTMASVGRLASGDNTLAAEAAITIAERRMRISLDDYLGRAIALWRAATWSIAFAVVDRQRVGCSIILPLGEPAYDALREGERDSHTCSPADLDLPSRSLFIEALGEKPDAEFPSVHRKTQQIMRTIYVQLAAMSLDADDPEREAASLRILSFAGNSTNAIRLKRSRFQPTGTTMPGFGIPFMELREQRAWWTLSVIRKLQERFHDGSESH